MKKFAKWKPLSHNFSMDDEKKSLSLKSIYQTLVD